jgi:tetratricopeptide (TPR) repeat protein
VQLAQGDPAGALKSYRDGLAIRLRLAQSDPGNTAWQRDLSVSYNKVGDVEVAQGDLAGALKSYRDSLAIRERLARSDPGNAGWQRDLAISYAKLAEVHLQSKDREKALAALRAGKAIMDGLVKLSPDNAGWKRELAWFDQQIAALDGIGDRLEIFAAFLSDMSPVGPKLTCRTNKRMSDVESEADIKKLKRSFRFETLNGQ